ncbi:MAG TPA: ribbon-helix-helix protein, CopG family [Acidimicrobiales bacterium]|nr:ribbon-helix-helix protein, CopG family [Acidimicrobiales bacterium]
MRTTITIDEQVYREAKAMAATSSRTVSELIEDAVRTALRAGERPSGELEPLPTFGHGGVHAGIDLAHRSSLTDAMDAGDALDALH